MNLPGYLAKDSIAVRKATNEIEYLENAVWAEGLQQGFLRVLTADLATRLPNYQFRLASWRREDVALEIYVTVQQFDVDTTGHGVLVAGWRVLSPGGGKTLKAGEFRASRPGPRPEADVQGATATLSHLVGDFSNELAKTFVKIPQSH